MSYKLSQIQNYFQPLLRKNSQPKQLNETIPSYYKNVAIHLKLFFKNLKELPDPKKNLYDLTNKEIYKILTYEKFPKTNKGQLHWDLDKQTKIIWPNTWKCKLILSQN